MRKKSAILVGCGYYGKPDERYGCENDVRTFEAVLPTFGFLPKNITKLIQPTKVDIEHALNNMSIQAGVGDVLCFYFSGLVEVIDSIPAIKSSDGQHITATYFQTLADQLPKNTSFTLVLESSHSAGFINPVKTDDKRILFSACQENETPTRLVPDNVNVRAYGVFTEEIRKGSRPCITNEELLRGVNERIERYHQHADIFCIPNKRNVGFLEYLPTN